MVNYGITQEMPVVPTLPQMYCYHVDITSWYEVSKERQHLIRAHKILRDYVDEHGGDDIKPYDIAVNMVDEIMRLKNVKINSFVFTLPWQKSECAARCVVYCVMGMLDIPCQIMGVREQ